MDIGICCVSGGIREIVAIRERIQIAAQRVARLAQYLLSKAAQRRSAGVRLIIDSRWRTRDCTLTSNMLSINGLRLKKG